MLDGFDEDVGLVAGWGRGGEVGEAGSEPLQHHPEHQAGDMGPKQKWVPKPKLMWGLGSRPRSRVSGSANIRSSRFADG